MAEISLREGFRSKGRNAFIAQLHDEAPVFRDPGGFWVASRFEDVRAILMDPATFSSAAMAVGAIGLGFPLLSDDPPRHPVLRGLLAKAFTPAAMEAMRPFIAEQARQMTDAIPPGEEVDVVERITSPLPVAVIARMMGVPPERAADFRRWSNAILGIQGNPFDSGRMGALMALRQCFTEIAAERRAEPGDDLVSALTRASQDQEVLNDDQVVSLCVLLMIAGNETTTNLLSNLLSRLAQRPADWAALRADPSKIDAAIEEALRIDAPIMLVARLTLADVELGGVTIPKGERVLAFITAANRDPAKWDDPANFEMKRIRERHLAFGHGIHSCIGAPLARIEASAVIASLTGRFAKLAPGREPGQRMRGSMLYGFQSLPLVFE